MHISLLNCCVSYFIRRLKIGNQLIISAQYAAWSATAQWLFLCERQESLFYLKHVFYFLHTEDRGFFTISDSICLTPVSLKPNKAVYYSSAIWGARRINQTPKRLQEPPGWKQPARQSGVIHTHRLWDKNQKRSTFVLQSHLCEQFHHHPLQVFSCL